MVNGALVTLGRVPSIVATIGTMTLFRGSRLRGASEIEY